MKTKGEKLERIVTVWALPCDWADEVDTHYYYTTTNEYGTSNIAGAFKVMEHRLELQLPDNLDLTVGIIEALEKEKQEIQKENNIKLAKIDERIRNLQSLEHKPERTKQAFDDDDIPF